MSVLEITKQGTTAILTMNRPEVRNAFCENMRNAFMEAIPELRDDKHVKAIVLTGAGGHFCSGGDVKTIKAGGSKGDIFEGRHRILAAQRWFDELVDLEKPVISAVDGSAYGAGLSLVLASDFVLASPDAVFCAVFARLGYVPDMGGMYLLPRVVGLSKAKELAFSARTFKAQEALELGVVHHVVSKESLLDRALALAAQFEHAPIGAIGIMKSVMNHAFENPRREVYMQEAMAQAMCRESEYHQEAINRFMQKEKPLYQWKES